ncbi:MAG: SCO6880 family protein, partial [Phycisphaeraceae bacterium]
MSELPTYQFPIAAGRGVLLGLSGPQLASVGLCGVVFVVAVSAANVTALLLGVAAIGVLLVACFVPVAGRPAVEWLPVWAGFGWAMATRNNEFYASPDLTGRDLPPGTLDLPGELFGLELHDHLPTEATAGASVANPTPAGYGIVRDSFRDRLVAIVEVSGAEFLFGDAAEQQNKISGWGGLLDHLAQSLPELTRLQVVHTVGPSSPEVIASYHHSHGGRGSAATAASYRQVLERAGAAAQDHRCLMAIGLDTKLARRAIRQAGGGLAGGGAVLMDRAAALEQGLHAAGVQVEGWLPARAVAQMLRVGFDPAARTARPADVIDGGGLDPAAAGPGGMVDGWSAVRHDSGWSTTLQVVAAPSRPVTGDFLQHLLIGVAAERRMSLLYVPTPMRTAERRAQ